ncbi:MAG: 50S ribosomal protein L13 [Candidatus Portnoybacteria bacterium RIFCSPLOWO2_12_FULL_39_9]|uniref:Large ribosomal subunit protein uL13 n=1 Tax=Candidatus Portnoybacteria bacterium RIFCSPHIGHO2_12_FULL_38_9 TaxID=1801997 RepID=A0A1G2FFY8_9BACT|nr:MAG: 50S ribosomal protein L13 [Candidatus Portnoybacteria bacterium RBG_13_40_8]OGZ36160.1 MAG: 50S ribosomal protein L13 [Candidatus Portnoybacteria bacterium RIFCSPHIGHO2_02_FULL_39_12]OGZ36518.1 MAG: 50S ribosomal protein L13 [Candidatus Portnoybacteria bacterium RIFCSPHIGHO2_12_FULL_38_9]OGZ38527.1 MAG: 50S ribosomal protein L13 [Candidatus Portnoybacteria bacterium RIFCSPLOWO2_01_FULL_38_39]OGZ41294.1 MAG: 50S ribosomal protein L13 [Candidatus Portnoybacteria bacterium RIFCSPLOWO2_12_F
MSKHTIDASGKILGRLAVEAAVLLRGKNKPDFTPRLDTDNEITVINTDKIRVTGRKLKQKIYYRHSGYPGGIRARRLEEMLEKDSREVVRKAVYGMLPKNKLRDRMIKRLKLYKGEKMK